MVDDSLQKLVQLMTNKKISEKWDIPVDLNGSLSWNKNKKTWSDMTVLLNKDTFKTSGEWNQNQISANRSCKEPLPDYPHPTSQQECFH